MTRRLVKAFLAPLGKQGSARLADRSLFVLLDASLTFFFGTLIAEAINAGEKLHSLRTRKISMAQTNALTDLETLRGQMCWILFLAVAIVLRSMATSERPSDQGEFSVNEAKAAADRNLTEVAKRH